MLKERRGIAVIVIGFLRISYLGLANCQHKLPNVTREHIQEPPDSPLPTAPTKSNQIIKDQNCSALPSPHLVLDLISPELPIQQPDGSQWIVDVRTIPLWRFEDNEAHAEGFYGMVVAANGKKVKTLVNGLPATFVSIRAGVEDWRIELPFPADAKLEAAATDEANNEEQTSDVKVVAGSRRSGNGESLR